MLVKTKKSCTWHGEEITEAKYDEILSMLRNPPEATEGYGYRLTVNLEWEIYQLPPVDEEAALDEEATIEDYEAALEALGVTV